VVSKFIPNWKVFDDANIADKFTNWTPVLGNFIAKKELNSLLEFVEYSEK